MYQRCMWETICWRDRPATQRKSCRTPVAANFRSFAHNADHFFSIQAIEKCKFDSTSYRKTKENFWIKKLKPVINQQKVTHDRFLDLRKKFHTGPHKTRYHTYRRRRQWGRIYSITQCCPCWGNYGKSMTISQFINPLYKIHIIFNLSGYSPGSNSRTPPPQFFHSPAPPPTHCIWACE